jgi:uncharacterized protein (DUF362 family)
LAAVYIKRIRGNISSALEELLLPYDGKLISGGDSVLIKPNLVEPRPYTSGETTNPHLVEAVVNWCYHQGAASVNIGEGPSYFQSESDLIECFTVTGMIEVAERNKARWILFDQHPFVPLPNPLSMFSVSTFAFKFDRIINLPVPKTHYLTRVSIAMKNLKGFLKRVDKPRFHHDGYGIHQNIVELNRIIKPVLNIVDITAPVQKNSGFILAGEDIVAVDAVTTSLMGFNPKEVKTVVLGSQAGLGEMDLHKIEIIGEETKGLKMNFESPQEWLRKNFPLLRLIGMKEACSGCMLPLFNTLSQFQKEGRKIKHPLSLLMGNKAEIRGEGEWLAVGDCTEGKIGEEMHLVGCPPKKDEMISFLRRFFEEEMYL